MYSQSYLIHYIHNVRHFNELANQFTGLWLGTIVIIFLIGFISECIIRKKCYGGISRPSINCTIKINLCRKIYGSLMAVFACILFVSICTASHTNDLQAKPETIAAQDLMVHNNQAEKIPHDQHIEAVSNQHYMQLKSHPSAKYNLLRNTEIEREHHIFNNAKNQLKVEHSQDEHNDPCHESIITQRTGSYRSNMIRGGYVKLPKLDYSFTHFPHFYQR